MSIGVEETHTETDRRDQPRIAILLPIEVSGRKRDGTYFCEQTSTLNISQDGCEFQMREFLPKGIIVSLSRLDAFKRAQSVKRVLFRVVRIRKVAEGYRFAANKIEEEDPWGLEFPRNGSRAYTASS